MERDMTAERLREIIQTLTALDSVARSSGRVFLSQVRFEAMIYELREHATELAAMTIEKIPPLICPACEAGDHGAAARCYEGLMKCLCACHFAGRQLSIPAGATK